jgi:hypothetical protein
MLFAPPPLRVTPREDIKMQPVDRSKLRNGDTVLVRGVVRDDEIMRGPNVTIDFGVFGVTPTRASSIVSIEPRPLQVGDRVRNKASEQGVVLALHEQRAWVQFQYEHVPQTYHVSNIERVA